MTRRLGPFGTTLALIAVLGFAGRLLYLYLSRDWILLGDGFAYRIESRRLLDGTVQGPLHPPLWTFVMAVPRVLGLQSTEAAQIMTALIGSATIVVTGLAGREAFGRRVGLVAAVVVAVYPNIWLYERELLSEPLAMFWVATFLLVVYRFLHRPGTGLAVALGALVGVMALTRSEFIFLSVAVVMPLILARDGVPWQRRVSWLLGAGVVAIVVIAPWGIYNSTRYERLVPLSAGLGPAMRAGNCPATYEGELLGYYEFRCIFAPGISTDPSVSDVQLRDDALEHIGADPQRSVIVAAARLGRAFNLYRPFQQADLEGERGTSYGVTLAGVLTFWVLVPLAVGGVVVARRRSIPVYPILAFVVLVVLAVLPTIGAVRYRAPAEVPLALLAAVSIGHLASRRWPEPESSGAPPRSADVVGADRRDLAPSLRRIPTI